MGMMLRKKAVIMSSPHIANAYSGNTSDSQIVAHFQTDMNKKLEKCTVSLPYDSNGYSSITITACGINFMKCDTFTNSNNSSGIKYTGHRDSNNEIDRIEISGKATQANCFRNLNFTSGMLKWVPAGTYASYCGESANVIFVGSSNALYDKDGNNGYTLGSCGWHSWDVEHKTEDTSEWMRIQLKYPSKDITFNETLYPMIVLEQDKECIFEPYCGQTYTITFPTTINSGTIDLLNGVIVGTQYTFTPISINTKHGVNNVWSNYGTVDIKYWTH